MNRNAAVERGLKLYETLGMIDSWHRVPAVSRWIVTPACNGRDVDLHSTLAAETFVAALASAHRALSAQPVYTLGEIQSHTWPPDTMFRVATVAKPVES